MISKLFACILSCSALFIFCVIPASGQNYNWIVPNKAYLKLSVVEDAMYRISRTDFTNAGINTATIDPRTVRLLNKGVEVPIHFEGQNDGVFDNADYFDFFGSRNYGGPTKFFNENNVLQYTKDEYYNPYSDTNVYWVEWGVTTGARYSTQSYSTTVPYPQQVYYENIQLEKDRLYTQGERIDGNDLRNFNNENFAGEGWYWMRMTTNQFVSDTFSVKTLTPQATDAQIKLFAYPQNRSLSINNEHSIQVQINSTYLPQVFTNDFKKIDTVLTFSSSLLNSATVNTVRVFYFSNMSFAGNMYFDMFRMTVPKLFRFNANTLSANLGGSDTASRRFKVSGYVGANPTHLYDVVNKVRIANFTSNADTLIFTARSNARLEISNKNITKKPFRIVQRQVPNLASASNEADYMIVYHPKFIDAVYQLQNHRETFDKFRVFNADIRDITDIFNYGIEDPVALRSFLKYAYDNWTQPRLKYVCLMGRGSTDPKRNISTSPYYQSYVPTYGNPTTDSYFANFNFGSYFYLPKVFIGRIPAFNTADAIAMVENTISYELSEPQNWWKVNTFIVGGGTWQDQQTFQALDTMIINNYALPAPLSADVHKIFRNDTTTTVTFNYKDSIRRDINNGCAIVNFLGHAGYENWEDGMQDPATLANYGRFPLVMSMTCYTGKNAESDKRSFGEEFSIMTNRGAVGFIGCSGWGWTISQTQLHAGMYDAIAFDTLRRFGEILKLGKDRLLIDSNSSTVRHTVNSYGLIGDPAAKLTIPKTPEYMIQSVDYKLSSTFPELNKKLTVTIYPSNIGLYSDSCRVRFTLKKNYHISLVRDTVLKPFNLRDSAVFSFVPDSLKDYAIDVVLDPQNSNPNEDKTNNFLTINIPLKDYSFVPLKPVHNSVTDNDSVLFTGLNPMANLQGKSVKVILELDTTLAFNSPAKKTFANSNPSGPATSFNSPLPALAQGRVYYWRTNSIINLDSAGWTEARIFKYDPSLLSAQNSSSSRDTEADLTESGPVLISKTAKNQFPSGDLNNTEYSGNGVSLKQFPLTLLVRSMGSSGAEASFFSVNYQNINIDGGRSPGLSMLKVSKINGTILAYKNIATTSGQSSDSVINFLNTFDSTHYLMALNASYVAGAIPLNASARSKIRTFGSTKIDSLNTFGWFDTWSFIGYLGATGGQVSEMFKKYSGSAGWVESNSSINTTATQTSGTIVNFIGPAQSWDEFSWSRTINPHSSLTFDVYGYDAAGTERLLLSNQTTQQFVDLSSIDAVQYPYIDLRAKFSLDTLTGKNSSILHSLKVRYTPSSDLVIDRQSIVRSDSVLKPGSEMKVTFNYSNLGYTDINDIIVRVYHTSLDFQNVVSSDTVIKVLKVDSTSSLTHKFKVPYVRPKGNFVKFFAEVVPKQFYTDIYTYNNNAEFGITQTLTNAGSFVNIYSDGVMVRSGDYVKAKPELKIEVVDEMRDVPVLKDTSSVRLFLNDAEVILDLKNRNSVATTGKRVDIDGKPGSDRELFYYPELKQGENRLKVDYTDASGANFSNEITLFVSDEMLVKDLYNFPNPMKNETNFLFNLTGDTNPGNCYIRIYTSAGRLIKEIQVAATVGFNQALWDGRDEDGDFVANGVYLYKLITEGDVKTETATQKLVILK